MYIDTKIIDKDSMGTNDIANKIANILGEDRKELGEKFEKEGTKKAIDDIFKKSSNQKNKKLAMYLIGEVDSDFFPRFISLHNDKDVCLFAVKMSSNNFYYVNKKFKSDLNIAVFVIKSMIRESRSFMDIRDFVLEFFPDNQKKLFEIYEKNLKKYEKTVGNDLDKILFALSEENKELVDLLKKNKIIKVSLKTTQISEKFIKNFIELLKNDKNIENIEGIKRKKLLDLLGIDDIKLTENVEFLIELILKMVNLGEQKKVLDENKKDEKNKKDNDKIEEKEDNIKEYEEDNNDDFDDLMDMEFSQYSYSSYGSYTNITTNEDFKIKISNADKEKFSSKALENYISFCKLFYKLGLDIFLKKYNLKSLLGFKGIDFNYTSGVGITQAKTLRILNLIGKNIGIPEVEVLVNGEEEPKKEVKCFKTFDDAKMIFKDIKSSSTINGEYIETNSNIGIFEKKLVAEGKLDYDKGSINLSKWG